MGDPQRHIFWRDDYPGYCYRDGQLLRQELRVPRENWKTCDFDRPSTYLGMNMDLFEHHGAIPKIRNGRVIPF